MRAFLGIALPDAVRQALGTWSGELRGAGLSASWVRVENLHLSLSFLGEIDEAKAARVVGAIEPLCAEFASSRLAVRGLGLFAAPRHARRPGVLWAGAHLVHGPMFALQSAIEEAVQVVGFEAERQPFMPHITLARVKNPAEIPVARCCVERYVDRGAGAFDARCVTLWRSVLGQEGPRYAIIREFPLACSPPPSPNAQSAA